MTINERFAQKASEATNGSASVMQIVHQAEAEVIPETQVSEPNAYLGTGGYGQGSNYSTFMYSPVFNGIFNGEKTQGALGTPMNLLPDYRALRFRAYEAQLTNPDIKIIAGKYFMWITGNGLKFQSEPYQKILDLEKVTVDTDEFKENVEAYFDLWCNSPRSDYAGMSNMHQNAKKQYETKFLGGDCLVICRLDDDLNLTTQIIDGQHIANPSDINLSTDATARGNTILNGIEIDAQGRHIAFYVNKMAINLATITSITPNSADYERVEAFGKETGCLMAWMAYGFKLRIDHQRGISSIAPILQRAAVMDRFTEATVQTAEEHAKVVYTLVHGKTSTGEDLMISNIKNNIGTPVAPGPGVNGNISAKAISTTENRQVHNLPVDSELKTVSSQAEIDFGPFQENVFTGISAAMNVPPEVALQKYSSNYSASRAAINSWGFIIDIERNDLILDYYQPIYKLWLYIHILKNKVDAPEYLNAKAKRNFEVVEAYSGAKFTGPKMPHIDPLKEINAIRTAMGDDVTPIISAEEGTDQWNGGDWYSNIQKVKKEKATLDKAGLAPPPPAPVAPGVVQPKPLET